MEQTTQLSDIYRARICAPLLSVRSFTMELQFCNAKTWQFYSFNIFGQN
jgi:hypothetical protein